MSSFEKYLKYKKKYLDLKFQLGGQEFTMEQIDNMSAKELDEKRGRLYNIAILNNNRELLEKLITKGVKYYFNLNHVTDKSVTEETYIKLVELFLNKNTDDDFENAQHFIYKINSEKFFNDFASDNKNGKYVKPDEFNIKFNTKNYSLFNTKGNEYMYTKKGEGDVRAPLKYAYGHLINEILSRAIGLLYTDAALSLANNNAEYIFEPHEISAFIRNNIFGNDRGNDAKKLINLEIIFKLLLPRRVDIDNTRSFKRLRENPDVAIVAKLYNTTYLLIYLNYAVIYFGEKSINLIKIFFEKINFDDYEFTNHIHYAPLMNCILNLCKKLKFDENIYKSYITRVNIYKPIESSIFKEVTKLVIMPSIPVLLEFRINFLYSLTYLYESKDISFEDFNDYVNSLVFNKDKMHLGLSTLGNMLFEVYTISKIIKPNINLSIESYKKSILLAIIKIRKNENKIYGLDFTLTKEEIEKELHIDFENTEVNK